jgi:hypothetical protein
MRKRSREAQRGDCANAPSPRLPFHHARRHGDQRAAREDERQEDSRTEKEDPRVRLVCRFRAREQRSGAHERGRRLLCGRGLSPRRRRCLAPRGGGLDALVATPALSALLRRPRLRSPLSSRRPSTGRRARRGIGRGRRDSPRRGWLSAGCARDGLRRRGLRGRRRRGIRRGVRSDTRRRSRRGIGLLSGRARRARKHERKGGQDKTGPQEDARDGEAHHGPAHPGEWSLRLQGVGPPWLASLGICERSPGHVGCQRDVNALLGAARARRW